MKRHHVHVCSTSKDAKAELAIMRVKLANDCFFTFNMHSNDPVAANYSRKQVDECDYVVFVITHNYGVLSSSGMGIAHLDYLYAQNKNRPMLVFESTHTPSAAEKSAGFELQKLEEFKGHVRRSGTMLIQYAGAHEFANKVIAAVGALKANKPMLGWNKEQPKQPQSVNRTQEIKAMGPFTPSGDKEANPDAYRVNLNDELKLSYRVHAYQDGNLTELTLTKTVTWGDVLVWFHDKVRMPETEEIIGKSINQALQAQALEQVQEQMPRAHAAAKTQINPSDLKLISDQIHANEWVQYTHVGDDGMQRLMLTPLGARQAAQWQSFKARIQT